MADEIAISGVVGGKHQGFTAAALPLGSETVEDTIGTDDILIVIRDGLSPALGSSVISNLIKELSDRLNEADYDPDLV